MVGVAAENVVPVPVAPPLPRPLPAPVAPAPDAPDRLAGALLRSLARPTVGTAGWGTLKTFALGVLSFGLFPLLDWHRRFGDMVRLERQQLWHLTEWLRLHSGHPDATALRDDAEKGLPSRGLLGVCALVWLAAVAIPLVGQMALAAQPVERLLEVTYGFRDRQLLVRRGSPDVFLFALWTAGVSFAYLLHWLRVQLHAADVRRFVERFNRLTAWEGVPPIEPARLGAGFTFGGVIGALVMFGWGALWGLLMMLAGGAHRRYSSTHSARTRAALAERVRMMMMLRRPVMATPRPLAAVRLCREPLCRAGLTPAAAFCPRCGTRQAGP